MFVVINYNSMNDCIKFLENFSTQKSEEVVLVFHDNDEDSDADERYLKILSIAKIKCPNLKIIPSGCGKNLGYLGGFNHATSQVNNLQDYDYIILTNPDIEFNFKTFFNTLKELKTDSALIIAPTITSKLTQKNQNPYMKVKPKQIKMLFFSFLFKSVLLTGTYRFLMAAFRKHTLKISNATEGPIYAGHGSFICFTSKFFKESISLNMPNFLFGEEFFIGRQLELNGYSAHYYPTLNVTHREHASTKIFPSATVCSHLQKAHHVAFRHYY